MQCMLNVRRTYSAYAQLTRSVLVSVRDFIETLRQKLPSYGKVDITIYECTCFMLICGGILLKFQQNTQFEMRNPIKVELIFCCVAFKHGTDFRGEFV